MDKYPNSDGILELTFEIFPVLIANAYSFANHVTEYDENIDSHERFKRSDAHTKAIERSRVQWEQGALPKVKVKITSQRYNIDLVIYYIKILEKSGQKKTTRVYLNNQYLNPRGWQFWQGWNCKVPLTSATRIRVINQLNC